MFESDHLAAPGSDRRPEHPECVQANDGKQPDELAHIQLDHSRMAHLRLAQQQSQLLRLIAGQQTSAPLEAAASVGLSFIAGERGLKAYQANAGMLAERVLEAAYPVLSQVVSAESLGGLARQLWRVAPPRRGDLAYWGADLADFLQTQAAVEDLPWLPDLARLEWAVHQAQTAADVATDPQSLSLLTTTDPSLLGLQLASACTVLRLNWNVLPLWQAHVSGQPESLGPEARAWAEQADTALLLWRPQWKPQLSELKSELNPAQAAFIEAILAGQNLLAALEEADPDWAAWLPQAWQSGLLCAVRRLELA